MSAGYKPFLLHNCFVSKRNPHFSFLSHVFNHSCDKIPCSTQIVYESEYRSVYRKTFHIWERPCLGISQSYLGLVRCLGAVLSRDQVSLSSLCDKMANRNTVHLSEEQLNDLREAFETVRYTFSLLYVLYDCCLLTLCCSDCTYFYQHDMETCDSLCRMSLRPMIKPAETTVSF